LLIADPTSPATDATQGPHLVRLSVFLTEDDRYGHRAVADILVETGRVLGADSARSLLGIEGFGRRRHLRAARLPDLARGLPLVVEIVGAPDVIAEMAARVEELAPGRLLTTELGDPDR